MAKVAISKRKPLSKHSREARRATSPSIDTDKSLKNVKPPPESADHRPSVLAIHSGAGVSKKQKRGRNLSTKAKKRAEKGMDKAAAVMDRTENKIAKSKGRARSIQTRAKTWDDINSSVPKVRHTTTEDGIDEDEDVEDVSDFDDEMGEADAAAAVVLQARNTLLTPAMEQDEDEIL
ncbi:Alb1-domain-containing protein [Pseudomassariella vexata]|uniref:Alb1-domain-containing protein n=1 Tax=Pseudomassariella vexata TaxID=1141098 RepID=A0A1Y2EM67_9PEZI|nr:Alb1-domain-containing protein [Pseudomassariella vexata]ORY71935.1 Alb1-domain-containing protein [Pseudomassariella vexata]